MSIDLSQLSSIAKTLEELTQRVARMGDDAHARHDDGTATELFAAERSISGATRRITRLIDSLRR
jgi:hypothetical protein